MAESSPAPRSDAEHEALVRAARLGEGNALDRWLEAEHHSVWKLCLGFSADPSAADDLAQDAMLHLSQKLDDWDEKRPWASWRRRIVLNLCRDRWRQNEVRRRAEGDVGEERAALTAPDPADEVQRAEVRAALVESLAQLPPREREVFVLKDLEQLPTREVAILLAIAESSVRSLLALARRRLRQHFTTSLPGLLPDAG